jgi:hypothetical protein
VTNTTKRRLSYLEVSFNVYDGGGNLVGNALDNVRGVEPGEAWRFEAYVTNETAVSAQFVETRATAAD